MFVKSKYNFKLIKLPSLHWQLLHDISWKWIINKILEERVKRIVALLGRCCEVCNDSWKANYGGIFAFSKYSDIASGNVIEQMHTENTIICKVLI